MSISNITGVDGKIIPGVLPNPYPFPASAAGLGAVLAVNNSALAPTGPPVPQSITDVGTLSAANIQAPFGAILAFNSDLIQNGVTANLGILPAGNLSLLPTGNISLKGAQTKGSMLVGDGTSTKELVAPALPNGSVLILDNTQPLGVRWGGESGPISTITAGNNIDILGTSANPIVAFQTPTTANIRLGVGTELEAKDNYITPNFTMSIDSTGLNYKYDIGGVVNQEDIAASSTNVVQTLSSTNSNLIATNVSTTDYINGVSSTYQYTDPTTIQATQTHTTSSLGATYQAITQDFPFGALHLTSFGGTASTTLGQMGVSYNDQSVPLYNAQGYINTDATGSSVVVQTAGGVVGLSKMLKMETPNSPSDSSISHTGYVGTGGNLAITSNQKLLLVADNIDLDANGRLVVPSLASGDFMDYNAGSLKVVNDSVGGTTNPLLVLQNTNNTAGAVAIETYKNDAPTSTGGDVISAWSSYCNALVSGVATKVEMTRISSVSQGVGTSNNDGSISLACKVNSSLAPQNFLVCNGGLGTGEIVVSKPISAATATNLDLFCGTAGGSINLNSVSNVDITAAGDNLTLTAGTLTLIDTPILELANVPTTTSTPTFTASIETTSAIGIINQFLKLKLNGSDIWIPYLTTDPSL